MISRSSSPSCWRTYGTGCRQTIVSLAWRHCPAVVDRPDVWLLGSSPQSGEWAAELGLPYAFADFINPGGAAIAAQYRQHFTSSGVNPSPRVIAAVWALCAETDQEAQRLASSSRMAFTLFLQGTLIPVPPVETAVRFLEEYPDHAAALSRRRRGIVGSPASVREQLEACATEYGAEELMIVTITYDHHARRRSYELIGEAFGLTPDQRTENT